MKSPLRNNKVLLTSAAGACSLALLLSGCAAAGSTDNASTQSESPLNEYMNQIFGDLESIDVEAELEQHKKIEAYKAECMTDEGFEYFPVEKTAEEFDFTALTDGPAYGTVEYAKENGYGLNEGNWRAETTTAATDTDPNSDYVMSLSESEQQAYYDALYGPEPTEEELAAASETGEFPEATGCNGEAVKQFQQADDFTATYEAIYNDPEFADLVAGMDQIYADVYDSGKMDAVLEPLNNEWSDCMADAGYTYDYPDQPSEELSAEYDALTIDPETYEPKDYDPAELKALGEKEIEIATADFTCREELKIDEKTQQVIYDVEKAFVEENKQQLEALVAKYSLNK